MMDTKYPYYFEVKCYAEGEYYEEGGFSYASDWDEAALDIKNAYGSELISMHIEMFDSYEFNFSIEKARQIKEAMGL